MSAGYAHTHNAMYTNTIDRTLWGNEKWKWYTYTLMYMYMKRLNAAYLC